MRGRNKYARDMAQRARAAVLPKSDRPAPTRMPSFQPSDQQRLFVAAMAGIRMTHREIALLVVNPRTLNPIDVNTLEKHFAHELDAGPAQFKSLIGTRFMEKVQAGEQWAVQYGLRAVNKLLDNQGSGIQITKGDGESTNVSSIEVHFVEPPPRGEDD